MIKILSNHTDELTVIEVFIKFYKNVYKGERNAVGYGIILQKDWVEICRILCGSCPQLPR
jgi:hypothetical protein